MIKNIWDSLIQHSKKYRNIVVLSADFGKKIGIERFALAFPEKCFNFGLAEANMVAASCGFAARGKIPFVFGYGNFALKAFDQIRDIVCYSNLNVKVVAVSESGGVTDGFGYETSCDADILKVLPNMKVLKLSDFASAQAAVDEMLNTFGPVYLKV